MAIQGFVYAPFRINDLIQGTFGTMFSNIDFEIYDGDFANKENILYTSVTKHQNLELYKTTYVTINGHTWTFLFKIRSILECGNIYIIFLIPLLLLALTLLLYLFLNSGSYQYCFKCKRCFDIEQCNFGNYQCNH